MDYNEDKIYEIIGELGDADTTDLIHNDEEMQTVIFLRIDYSDKSYYVREYDYDLEMMCDIKESGSFYFEGKQDVREKRAALIARMKEKYNLN